jgi:hypothetical protein
MPIPSQHRAVTTAGQHRARQREPGRSSRAIATVTVTVPLTLGGPVNGRRHVAVLVTTIQPTAVGRRACRVDAGGTRLRLRALHVMGHSCARIARAAGASEQTIQKITRGQTATVHPALRDAVTAVYDAWWDKRAPGETRARRAAATAARRRAATGNWCAGAGLDDDQLDRPGYQPTCGWRPATGTGVADDICLPAPDRQAGIA